MKLTLDIELDYTNPNDAQIPFNIWYNLLDKLFIPKTITYESKEGRWSLIINTINYDIIDIEK